MKIDKNTNNMINSENVKILVRNPAEKVDATQLDVSLSGKQESRRLFIVPDRLQPSTRVFFNNDLYIA